MFFEDLSELNGRKGASAIGWLSGDRVFPIGPTSRSFGSRLRELAAHPISLTRGYHLCPFCLADPARGNGEIEVPAPGGRVFVAPALIAHYVDAHNYLPPEAFVQAVEQLPPDADVQARRRLVDCVLALADDPTQVALGYFCGCFMASRFAVPVPSKFGPIPAEHATPLMPSRHAGDNATTGILR